MSRVKYYCRSKERSAESIYKKIPGDNLDGKFKEYFKGFGDRPGPVWDHIPKAKLLRQRIRFDQWIRMTHGDQVIKLANEEAERLDYEALMAWQNLKHAEQDLEAARAKNPASKDIEVHEGKIENMKALIGRVRKLQEEQRK